MSIYHKCDVIENDQTCRKEIRDTRAKPYVCADHLKAYLEVKKSLPVEENEKCDCYACLDSRGLISFKTATNVLGLNSLKLGYPKPYFTSDEKISSILEKIPPSHSIVVSPHYGNHTPVKCDPSLPLGHYDDKYVRLSKGDGREPSVEEAMSSLDRSAAIYIEKHH